MRLRVTDSVLTTNVIRFINLICLEVVSVSLLSHCLESVQFGWGFWCFNRIDFSNKTNSMKLRKNNITGAVNSLLDTISDKDDGVKNAVERSLVRMCKRRPNETIEILYNYRQKCLKLTDVQVALLLR